MKIVKTINLKKYSNRKLYSPVGELADVGCYCTLKDVAIAVKEGNTVIITDNVTGEDITNNILKETLKDLDLSTSKLVSLIREELTV